MLGATCRSSLLLCLYSCVPYQFRIPGDFGLDQRRELLRRVPDRLVALARERKKLTLWMVVLIVGIGLSGYVTYKLFRGRAGVVLGGILGGLVSSTATILVAALANVAFKAGVVFFLGSPKLFVKILPVFGAAFAGGVAILLAWPG